MSIYQIEILDPKSIKNFKPTRLYIKECAGVRYFGKSTLNDISSYTGSGTIWKKRIKKYGKESVQTIWVSEWYHDPIELQNFALEFSKNNQIVESPLWANMKPENGLNGGMTKETAKKIRSTPEAKEKYKNAAIKRSQNPEYISNLSKQITKAMNDPKYKEKYKGSNHNRYDHTIYKFEHISGIIEISTQQDFRLKYNLCSSKVSNIIHGKRKSHKGWRIIAS